MLVRCYLRTSTFVFVFDFFFTFLGLGFLPVLNDILSGVGGGGGWREEWLKDAPRLSTRWIYIYFPVLSVVARLALAILARCPSIQID